jgi:hypothetical protein
MSWFAQRNLGLSEQNPSRRRSRSCRVLALLFTIVLLSLADLYITLVYLHSGGMGEANPLARWIMGHGSPVLLTLWKLLTVGVAVAIFYKTRFTRASEFGAWTCVLLLTWLTIRWGYYSEEITKITPSMHTLAEHDPARWMTMTER